ncbi:radical SAM/SPASM domain-containing protein [Sporomusa malonica]|uniref:Radical SAM additional 4Fe4S-binding SPASM domain-containing protein n=1 Tax=Sporomusa malonica TaxID=112901 RepID=A0A1W1YAG4_9FIRM|nr:radical SAM protein [Sporomusa malonica]SMC33200.1 radical SAM additional 4Fe4S-binding SPASM domain-containing protein [Sporomusa malonica]
MRYAKLKKQWLLRGWTDEPWTLLNWMNGDCRELSEQLFLTARACDGQTDFHNIAGVWQQNLLLDKLIREGIAEECSLGEGLQPYQQFRKADNPYVRSVHWSITGRCNLKCRHCYMESPDARYEELPLPDILRIIDQLAAANVHLVELSGGEPFMRRDLPDIMAALAEKQIAVSRIYSNGILISDEVLQGIKKLGFSPSIQISFDGCGTHDDMRGVTGIERATIEAIRRLREQGFLVTVATSIDRINVSSLAETYALMKELNIQSWRVAPPQEMGNWRQNVTGLTLEEVLLACAPISACWSADGRPFQLRMPGFNSLGDNEVQDRYSPDSYDCTSCRSSCSLLPDGTVMPCPGYTDTIVYEQMPNLLRETFAKIWLESTLRTIIDIKKSEILAHNSECADCSEFKHCGGGCRAMAVSATGNLLSKDPQFCEIYKSKYRDRFAELHRENYRKNCK